MKFYQATTDQKAIAAVYEEYMDWETDPATCEYEAWAVTAYGIERIYVKKRLLEQCCTIIPEEEVEQFAPGLIETLRIARPDDVRAAQASPHFFCEHGAGCVLPEHNQGQLWREWARQH